MAMGARRRQRGWIPAFAGMTWVSVGMTGESGFTAWGRIRAGELGAIHANRSDGTCRRYPLQSYRMGGYNLL